MKKGRKIPKKQSGGYLHGPSHEEGGIIASTNGETVELEGGEYIINAQTVDALGTEFLDKINSTATTYHDGGFEQGQLPNPSQYRSGGQIRRNNMRRKRKFAHGGYHPTGNGFGMNPYQYGVYNNPYRKGGKVRRKFGHGGMMRNGNGCPPGMHMMPDGSCMEGAYHGANGSYRHGGFHAIPGTGGPGMPPPRIPDIMSVGDNKPFLPMNNPIIMSGMGGMGRKREVVPRRRRREYAHGGMMRNGECAPGEMCHGGYHNGMRRGVSVRRRYAHGGYHSNGNGINAGSPSSCIDGMGRNVPC